MNHDKKILNLKETAELLQVCKRTVYEMVKQKTIPCTMIASQWRFNKDTILEWLDKNSKIDVIPKPKKTVLLIEDDTAILNMLGDLLECEIKDTDIIRAENWIQAKEKINHTLPDVILLDIELPGKSGIDICRIIKENPLTDHTRIIVLTGHEHYRQQAMEAGADEFLLKPVSEIQIALTIQKFLKTSSR